MPTPTPISATARAERREAPALLNVDAAAEHLAVSRRTVWQLAASGDIPRVALGPRTTRFRRADLDALVARRTR